MELKEKLYTSTQVADILGVSLRTLYRYMEDGKIQSMRTASGRHRFTRENILEFLNAGDAGQIKRDEYKTDFSNRNKYSDGQGFESGYRNPPMQSLGQAGSQPSLQNEDFLGSKMPFQQGGSSISQIESDKNYTQTSNSDQVDRSQFPLKRSNFDFYNDVDTDYISFAKPKSTSIDQDSNEISTKPVVDGRDNKSVYIEQQRYYKSGVNDLMELARKIRDISTSKDLDYGFTMYAGLSVHFPIKPFEQLHFYINPEDMNIWQELLRLIESTEREADLVAFINSDIVFVPTKTIGGFKIVDDRILLQDLSRSNELDLVREFRRRVANT